MPTFEEWAGKSGLLQIFLVETSAMRVADGAIIPLYFSDYPPDNLSRFYLPCIKEMPRLTRQSNDTLTPNHVPTWGDLTLWAQMDYKPDGANSLTWRELLSGAYTFIGQPLVLKVGGEEFGEADYYTLFTGHIGGASWDEGAGTVTFRLYDKGQDLDRKIPNFELPESPFVAEDSWNQLIPLPLGTVKNYKPVLIRQISGSVYLYALAGAVIHALDVVYYKAAAAGAGLWTFNQKDVSPAAKDAEGSAILETFGSYTGAAVQREWIIQIDSITLGSEVGQATFRYSTDGGETWTGGILTWKLAYDPTTLAKSPAAGDATITVTGDYTGTAKLTYKVKVVTEGHIGGTPNPQFVWSDDNGVSWSAPVDILDNGPILLNRGLSVAFPTTPGVWSPDQTWTHIGSALGTMISLAINPGDSVAVEITTTGSAGLGAMFRWNAGGGWSAPQPVEPSLTIFDGGSGYVVGDVLTIVQGLSLWNKTLTVEAVDGAGAVTAIRLKDVGRPDYTVENGLLTVYGSGTGCKINIRSLGPYPIELFAGHSIGFTELGVTGVNDFEAGDAGTSVAVYTEPFVVDDQWSWGFKEVPVPLGDGVSIQFHTQAGQDFELLDEWRFRLISTVLCAGVDDTTDITADAQGMIDPASLGFVSTAADIIRSVIAVWAGWDPAGEFDLAAQAAFNSAIPYNLGLLLDSPTAISEIIDTLLTGIPAVYGITLEGKFYLKEITNPAGTPLLSLTDVEYFPSRTGEKDNENLYRRVYLRFDRNWSTNQNAAGVTQERLQWLRREWRQISKHNQDLEDSKEAHDLGPLDTCLIDRDETALLAQKLIDLYGTRRESQQVETKMQPFRRNIWDTVAIDGLPFALKSLELDMYDRSTLTVWR
jgi:hypothetical protein